MNDKIKCHICLSEEFSTLFTEKDREMRKCLKCGLGVTHPFPSPDELAALYSEDYFSTEYEKMHIGTPEFQRKISQERHRIKLVSKYMPSGRLLDIGCGLGYFAYAAEQSGYMAEGLDITDSNIEYITGELGINLIVSELEKADLDNNVFDVITLWHNLEHLRNPRESLKKCYSLLKDSGIIIIEVPNHECIDARKEGTNWHGWQMPFHLHHFTSSSLQLLLKEEKFEVLGIKTYHSAYVKKKLKPYLTNTIARLIARCYASTGIAMVCKKAAR